MRTMRKTQIRDMLLRDMRLSIEENPYLSVETKTALRKIPDGDLLGVMAAGGKNVEWAFDRTIEDGVSYLCAKLSSVSE